MSAVVASLGPVFVTETGRRSASAGGAYLTETAVNYVDLAGDLSPSLTFAGDLTVVAGGPWTPNLLPGLNIWLDASQLALADGAQVSAWANAGSGPPTVFQDSLPLATFKTNQLNGKSVVRLGAGGSRIRFTGTGINKDYTVAYVARNWGPTGGTGGRVVSSQYPAGGNLLLGYWDAYMDVGFAGSFFLPDHKILFTNDWRLYSAWCNSTTPEARLYSSGVFIGGQAGGAVSEGFGGTFNLNGINDALDETCNCDIAEVLLYDRQLSDSDRIQVENYLNAKWLTAPVGIVDLAGDLAVTVNFAADVADLFSLTGDLAPSVSFAADLSVSSISYVDLAGNLAPGVAFIADLTVAIDTRVYVDFSGNLGGVSQYGKLQYGLKHYSRIDAFAPVFVADLDIVGQDFFNGDLRPVVTFSGALSLTVDLGAGDLTPVVTFSGTIGLQADLSGDIAPQITIQGDLTFDLPLAGDLSFEVDLAASSLISGPLWAASTPCPTPPWTATEPCPPSLWTPVPPPTFTPPSGGWTKQEEEDDLPVWGDAS